MFFVFFFGIWLVDIEVGSDEEDELNVAMVTLEAWPGDTTGSYATTATFNESCGKMNLTDGLMSEWMNERVNAL